jgi:hypothetical protein
MARHLFVRCEKTAIKKINERPTFSFQSCRANQSFQLGTSSAKTWQLKLRNKCKKFLPAASILMTFVVLAQVIGIFCILSIARVVYSRSLVGSTVIYILC